MTMDQNAGRLCSTFSAPAISSGWLGAGAFHAHIHTVTYRHPNDALLSFTMLQHIDAEDGV